MNPLRILILASIVCALVLGTVITLSASPTHEAVAQIMLKRSQLERAGGASEDSKNRWVWVRDGLELKNQLLSDEVLVNAFSLKDPSIAQIDDIRKSTAIHYSGGDDNLFTIKVKNRDAAAAIAVVDSIVKVFPTLAVANRVAALEESIKSIEKQPPVSDFTNARRAEIVETLRSDLAFAQAESSNRVILVANTKAVKIWPRPIFIYTASMLIAFFLACVIGVTFRIKGT